MSGPPAPVFPNCHIMHNPKDQWSILFSKSTKKVTLAQWDATLQAFTPGPRISEVSPRFGNPETAHLLSSDPSVDPEGLLNTEYIFKLKNLDFSYINIEQEKLSTAWSKFVSDPEQPLLRAIFLKTLSALISNYYGESGSGGAEGGGLTSPGPGMAAVSQGE